ATGSVDDFDLKLPFLSLSNDGVELNLLLHSLNGILICLLMFSSYVVYVFVILIFEAQQFVKKQIFLEFFSSSL
ncbi:hypothetical protein GIB67_028787, partial [Kingdonia uniflora]